MRQRFIFLLCSFLLSLALLSLAAPASFAEQSKDVALVIGNAAYPDAEAPLKEPLTDARAIADQLKNLGFDVEIGENLKKEQMQKILARLYDRVKPNATALIFFSGFGIQSDRQSYMIPVDAQIWNEADVRRDGFSLDKVLAELTGKGAQVKVAIVDASRRNPFERRFRSVSAGLAAVTATKGSVVMSAAPPDTVIGYGSPPVFVTELVKELKVGGATIEQIFNRTRIDVSRATQGQQVPWFSSSLEEDVALGSQSKAVASSQSTTTTAKSDDAATTDTKPTKTAAKSDDKPAATTADKDTAADKDTVADKPSRKKNADKSSDKSDDKPATSGRRKKTAVKSDEPPPPPPPSTTSPSNSSETVAAKEPVTSSDPEADARHDYVAAEGVGTKKAWDDFVAKHPSGYYFERAKEQMAKLSPDDKPKDVAGFYRRGQRHAVDGEYANANDDFGEVIKLDPKHAGALNNRCWVRTIIGDYGGAQKDCTEALRIAPNYMDALDSRGFMQLKIGKFKEAIADYDAALRIEPKHASSLYGRGIAETRSGDAAAGKRDVNAAKAIKPNIADEFAGYGIH